MPGWVSPAVAAELWGTTEARVLEEVAAGRVAWRREGEFLFVDVATDAGGDAAEPLEAPRPAIAYRRPLTWAFAASDAPAGQPVVSPAERDALLDETRGEDEGAEDPPAPAELTADDVPDWDQVRARVSRLRRPPGARAAA